MKFIFLLCFIFFTGQVFANTPGPRLKIRGNDLEVLIEEGYHFNTMAPARLLIAGRSDKIPPAVLKEKHIRFPLVDKTKTYSMKVYVCDDKNTSCELIKKDFTIAGDVTVETTTVANPTTEQESPLSAAIKIARQEHKKILYDVAAPWCPACVRLESEVYSNREFQALTKDLVKVTINFDEELNKNDIKKFEVKVIPTVLLLNENGEELARMIDYKPAPEFIAELSNHLKNSIQTKEEILRLAQNKNKEAIRELALRAYNMFKFDEAKSWFDQLNEDSVMKTETNIKVAEELYNKDKKTENAYADLLAKGIVKHAETYEAMEWRIALAEIDKKKAENLLNENITRLRALLNDEKALAQFMTGTSSGTLPFPRLEAYSLLLHSTEGTGNKIALDKVREEMRREIKKVKTSTDRPGEMMMVIQYQRDADMPEMEQSLISLTRKYPENYVYHMKLGGFYFRKKAYKKALKELSSSTRLEKENSLYHITLLAKTQKALGMKKELKKTVEYAETLPEAKKPEAMKELHNLLL